MQVNILEAKTNLSSLVRMVETGKKECGIIARCEKPIVMYNDAFASKRIGIAKGKLKSPDNLDKFNDEIAEMFGTAEGVIVKSGDSPPNSGSVKIGCLTAQHM